MLVDLHRNDLGTVARAGTVTVPDFMVVERYSHVIHIVSSVSRSSRPECSALDALLPRSPPARSRARPRSAPWRSSTSSSPSARGPYGGAIGYFSLLGRHGHLHHHPHRGDQGRRGVDHAGAGIVADSDPRVARPRRRRAPGAARLEARDGAVAPRPASDTEVREAADDPGHRQLRLVHLQPGAVPAVAGPRGRGEAQRRARPVADVLALEPEAGSCSRPGPGRPEDAGICVELLQSGAPVPILGVCLGHQALGLAFGGHRARAGADARQDLAVQHDGRAIFAGLPEPLQATRYHCLASRARDLSRVSSRSGAQRR